MVCVQAMHVLLLVSLLQRETPTIYFLEKNIEWSLICESFEKPLFLNRQLPGDFFLGRVSSKLVFKISLLTHRNENVWKIV